MPEPATPHPLDGSIGLAGLGAQLRAELRDDESMWVDAAAQRWAHGRRLVDVVRDYAARGDRVVIEVASRAFEGLVTAVGDDRIDLSTVGGVVTVRAALGDRHAAVGAPVLVRRSVRARAGGCRLPSALVTFRARLLEFEAAGCSARVGLWSRDREHLGPIVVGHDHVIVRGDAEVIVPTSSIAYVAAAPRGDG